MMTLDGNRVRISGSTITGNGSMGIVTTVRGRAKVHDSTVVDNDTSLVCAPPMAVTCFDIGSGKASGRPSHELQAQLQIGAGNRSLR